MRIGGLAVTLAAALGGVPASAAWYEARSPHFVVYADGSAASVETTARQLEQFDAAIRRVQRMEDPPETHANPLTVYVAPTVTTVQRLCGGCANVYGFYRPSVSGSAAFTPRTAPNAQSAGALSPRIVLLHEYGHHLLLGNYAAAYPAWFSEGYAEFVSTATFEKDSIMVGRAANHRAYSLLEGSQLPAAALFASATRRMTESDVESVYARGWLLTHYITFNADRSRQFSAYLKRLNDGEPSLDAATAAFGDLRQLDKDLNAYLNRSHLSGIRVMLASLPAPAITVRPLRPGEEAMIDLRMASDAGVDKKQAASVYRRAATVAARYPDDPTVQGWLAEMAFDGGHEDEADAAAGRALSADPKAIQALLYRGRVHLRRAAGSHDEAVWREARTWIVKANRVDPNNAEALFVYYRSFIDAGEEPRKSAVVGLERAFQLVPQDPEVRIAYGRQAIRDGNREEAQVALRPLAYSPHAAGADDYATRLLAVVNAGGSGPAALQAFDAETERLITANAAK